MCSRSFKAYFYCKSSEFFNTFEILRPLRSQRIYFQGIFHAYGSNASLTILAGHSILQALDPLAPQNYVFLTIFYSLGIFQSDFWLDPPSLVNRFFQTSMARRTRHSRASVVPFLKTLAISTSLCAFVTGGKRKKPDIVFAQELQQPL